MKHMNGELVAILTDEEWLKILEIKYNNYKILSEEFNKSDEYDIIMSVSYLLRVIELKMKLIKKKHCE